MAGEVIVALLNVPLGGYTIARIRMQADNWEIVEEFHTLEGGWMSCPAGANDFYTALVLAPGATHIGRVRGVQVTIEGEIPYARRVELCQKLVLMPE